MAYAGRFCSTGKQEKPSVHSASLHGAVIFDAKDRLAVEITRKHLDLFAAILVTNNALCLMSGLLSGI